MSSLPHIVLLVGPAGWILGALAVLGVGSILDRLVDLVGNRYDLVLNERGRLRMRRHWPRPGSRVLLPCSGRCGTVVAVNRSLALMPDVAVIAVDTGRAAGRLWVPVTMLRPEVTE